MLLQRQKQICNYCDITISGQCFSRLVFIAFRLWPKRLKWQRAYLQPHPSLLQETWLFWKMAAHVETRTHLLPLCGRGDAIREWQQSALNRGIYPSCHLHGPIQVGHPSKCRGDGRNPHLPFSVTSYLLSREAVAMSHFVFKGL